MGSLANDSVRYWSWNYYYLRMKEGAAILWREERDLILSWLKSTFRASVFSKKKKNNNNKRLEQAPQEEAATAAADRTTGSLTNAVTDPVVHAEEDKEKCKWNPIQPLDDQPTTILYGIHILSSLTSLTGCWVPQFIFDIRLGLQPSRGFVMASYFTGLLGFISGVIISELVVDPTVNRVLPGLITNVYFLISTFVLLVEFSYVFFAMFSLIWIVYHRHFIREFFLYNGSLIALPRSTQRREVVKIFATSYLQAFCSVPLFILLALWQDIKQPEFMPHLGALQFLVAKFSIIYLMVFAALLLSLLNVFVLILTRFLIKATARHLELLFSKQLLRLNRIRLRNCFDCENLGLEAMADKTTRRIMKQYSCDTLVMDWPSFGPPDDVDVDDDAEDKVKDDQRHQDREQGAPSWAADGQTLAPFEVSGPSATGDIGGCRVGADWAPPSSASSCSLVSRNNSNNNNNNNNSATPSNRTSTAGSLLFLYRNLVKSLSELKGIIETYEQKFGRFHFVLICINGLIVAQWVVAGLTQVRLIRSTLVKSGRAEEANSVGGVYFTPFAFRIGCGIVMFVVSNIYTFLDCDCLPRRLSMMQSQLFKINVDLAISHCQSLDSAAQRSLIRTKNELIDYQLPELDQVWSLYDQVVRMSKRANFKLTSGAYYDKNCLLLIFGREVSLVLLYVQVIDIYTNV